MIISLIAILIATTSFVSAVNYFDLADYQQKWSGPYFQQAGEGNIRAPTHYVVTGIALGSYDLNEYENGALGDHILSPMGIYIREMFHDGTLGRERLISLGLQSNIERSIRLPDGFVMTGWGGGVEARKNGNWVIDYLEVTARKLNTNGLLEGETLFVNKTSNGTLDTKVKLNDGYVATLIGGVVYKGTLDVAKIGGKRITVNGQTINVTNIVSNYTNQTNQTSNNQTNTTNHSPSIDSINVLGHYAGDLFKIIVGASDTEGNALSYSYSHPFNSNGEWQTSVNTPVGTYNVNVSVSDGSTTTTMDLDVQVFAPLNNQTNSTNHAPVIHSIDYDGDEEGDFFTIDVDASDADGDDITITCSSPFGDDCEWQTHSGDDGDYDITVTVSDGIVSVSDSITVTVDTSDNDRTDGNSDHIRYVGEFQNNSLALNGRLYNDGDAYASQNGPISISYGESDSQSTSQKSYSSFSLITLFLVLILLAILSIIVAMMVRARK